MFKYILVARITALQWQQVGVIVTMYLTSVQYSIWQQDYRTPRDLFLYNKKKAQHSQTNNACKVCKMCEIWISICCYRTLTVLSVICTEEMIPFILYDLELPEIN